MAILTREQILARKLGAEPVKLGDGSGEVLVRGLSRQESHAIGKLEDNAEREVQSLAAGLVDPAMSADDCRAWMGNDSFGALQPVVQRIMELSGMAPGQGKDATKSVPRSRAR